MLLSRRHLCSDLTHATLHYQARLLLREPAKLSLLRFHRFRPRHAGTVETYGLRVECENPVRSAHAFYRVTMACDRRLDRVATTSVRDRELRRALER